jgi:hypothetical protein
MGGTVSDLDRLQALCGGSVCLHQRACRCCLGMHDHRHFYGVCATVLLVNGCSSTAACGSNCCNVARQDDDGPYDLLVSLWILAVVMNVRGCASAVGPAQMRSSRLT